MNHTFIVDPSLPEAELNRLVAAAETQIIDYRKSIAQLEQIRDMAKHTLISRAIQEAEVE